MFDDIQKAALKAPLSSSFVKTRKQGGRDVSYIEGWKAIDEANRIFGFDGWARETVDIKCVAEGERQIGSRGDTGYSVTYIVKVRVRVGDIMREGCGAGHGIDRDLGQAHESALKEAETDAMKRALMTFGNPFGLALYDKQQANVVDESKPVKPAPQKQSAMPEDFTARVEYMVECREAIAQFTDAESLAAWWKSEEQAELRRKHQLDQSQVDALKQAVINRRDALQGKRAA
ncbi:DNA repair and recombination protein RAD52 [Bradyrhizobium yuanmingense]|uniref:DNA repair and recombination protein RAD52 n=1 Tax=Bradyrhizobium yuanmingense TaxID=108015 RepID=A0A1C3XHM3_9BRAD|nr:RAD52 family DNA repair protein [Bradyrhizobium yuanmingense]TWI18957.1 DNA repair and recombination protein RAD52 [Bradyrhizobium yuanmingense]SCB51748.1 DNA repair and recombination protein RAD52 [Bradyrhizobium yuanmingense]